MKIANISVSSILIPLTFFLVPSDAFAQAPALSGSSGNTAPPCSFTRALYKGLSGNDVSCLQQWLLTNGYSIPAGATGYFGTQTMTVVAAWQRAQGVYPAAGYFGPLSQRTSLSGTIVTGSPIPSRDSSIVASDTTAKLDSLMSSIEKDMQGLEDDLSHTGSLSE